MDYTVKRFSDVADVLGDYPGEMRMLTEGLGNEQVAVTWRRMPAQTGGKGSYGHHHKKQEEVYLVLTGSLQFKLGDEVIDVPARSAVRVPPETVRSVWNEGPEEAELVIVSKRLEEGASGDAVQVPDFWPA